MSALISNAVRDDVARHVDDPEMPVDPDSKE